MEPNWMIYGANGYTGELIVEHAVSLGLRPTLAGRNREKTSALASKLGLPVRIFPLRSLKDVIKSLEGINTVLNCAGPFSHTAKVMMEACLVAKVNYLDITGEIGVFELAHSYNDRALASNISLIPGVGFDVVPSDCLALKLKHSLPAGQSLTLGIYSQGGASLGTRRTGIEGAKGKAKYRKNGIIMESNFGDNTMEIPYTLTKTKNALLTTWGDVSSAYRSTDIPNIEVYMAAHPKTVRRIRRLRWLRPIFSRGVIQRLLKWRTRVHKSPSKEIRDTTKAFIWVEVRDPLGNSRIGELVTPNAYTLTALVAVESVRRTLGGGVRKGTLTPAQAFGEDFITEFGGVQLKLSQ